MININIFPELLNCAFNSQILNFQKAPIVTIQQTDYIEMKHACYILTSSGDLEINVSERLYRKSKGLSSIELKAEFKSNIAYISEEEIKNLIYNQLDTEIFLKYSNCEETKILCEIIN